MNNNQVLNFDDYTSSLASYGNNTVISTDELNPCINKPIYLTYGASISVSDSTSIKCNTLSSLNQFNIRGLGITVNNGKTVNFNAVTLSNEELVIDTSIYGITSIVAISIYTTNEIPFLFKYEGDNYKYKKVLFDIFGAEIKNTACVGVPNKFYLKGCIDLQCYPKVEIMLVGI